MDLGLTILDELKGTVSGRPSVEQYYTWPNNNCRDMKTPESFLDVRSYSKEILDMINSDGDQECQETIEI